MITEILLSISVIINIVMVFYVKWILNNYKEVVLGLENIGNLIAEYVIHLKSVYELEMFYGDDTLSSLLEHGKQIVEKLEDIELLGENDEDDDEQDI
tara:strand:+ start:7428 stop:7718 length:291 start_codon:yes stop_codon:yes gene_type:complete